MEIVIGLIIAIVWIYRERRYDFCERGDWNRITKDIVDKLK